MLKKSITERKDLLNIHSQAKNWDSLTMHFSIHIWEVVYEVLKYKLSIF